MENKKLTPLRPLNGNSAEKYLGKKPVTPTIQSRDDLILYKLLEIDAKIDVLDKNTLIIHENTKENKIQLEKVILAMKVFFATLIFTLFFLILLLGI